MHALCDGIYHLLEIYRCC